MWALQTCGVLRSKTVHASVCVRGGIVLRASIREYGNVDCIFLGMLEVITDLLKTAVAGSGVCR